MTFPMCKRTPNHWHINNRQIPRTPQDKSRWQKAEIVESAAVIRMDHSVADYSQLLKAKKPPKRKLRDVSTQTEELETDFARLDVFTQTNSVNSTMDAGSQTNAKTMETVGIIAAGISVKKVGTVAEVKIPPPGATVKPAVDRSNCSTDANYTMCRTWKLWKNRFSLFSRFELGVMLDEESFYSECPEVIAAHMASRCAYGTVVDPFCGAGGIAIQLARTCRKVIAVDIDPAKIKLARRNASIYGVDRRIDFRVGDSFKMLAGIKADAVVTSPPWTGRFHAKHGGGEKEYGMAGVLKMAHEMAPRVVLQLPKSINRTQCLTVSRKANFGRVEFEDVIVDGCTNSMNVYLKSRQNDSPPGPAITSTVILKFPENVSIHNDWLDRYSSYLSRTKKFLATH